MDILSDNQTKMLATCTSKYFEDNMALLRNEVSRYIARGICIVDHNYNAPSVLTRLGTVYTLCKEIARTRKQPFVSVEFFRGAYLGGKGARVIMPLLPRVKCLSAQVMMIGVNAVDGDGVHSRPIMFQKKNGLTIYYNGDKGMAALEAWLHMCATDNAMRFALGLPTIVTRSSVTS